MWEALKGWWWPLFHTDRSYPHHFRAGQNVLVSLFITNLNNSSELFMYWHLRINILSYILTYIFLSESDSIVTIPCGVSVCLSCGRGHSYSVTLWWNSSITGISHAGYISAAESSLCSYATQVYLHAHKNHIHQGPHQCKYTQEQLMRILI